MIGGNPFRAVAHLDGRHRFRYPESSDEPRMSGAKVTWPISVGTWILTACGPLTSLAAAAEEVAAAYASIWWVGW
jgi:hypothetical protein